MYFEMYQQKTNGLLGSLYGEWRWRLRSANYLIIASGEGYHNKNDCIHAINLVKSTITSTPVHEVNN